MRKKLTSGILCLAIVLNGILGYPFAGRADAAQEKEVSNVLQENERQELNFNTDWLFIDEDDVRAKEPEYDESKAQGVSLPHSLGEYDLFHTDDKDWQKVTWYRRHFTLKEEEKGNRVSVYFDGGGQINEVYVNGAYVGRADGTFTHFSFDITDYITFGEVDNVISVRVDSKYHYESLPPAENDFHWMGGLHGDARMLITDALYLESTFYWTEKIGKDTYQEGSPVKLKGEVQIQNSYESDMEAVVHTSVKDKEGSVVAENTEAITVGAGVAGKKDLEIQIDNPNLWSPEHPYLYQVETWVEADGVRLDSQSIKTGLRWIGSTGKSAKSTVLTKEDDQQILLNDRPIRLYGINKNMQFAYIGNSGTKKLQEKDAYTLKYDLGMNFVRTAHYENDPDFFAACDEIGLLVEEEALGWSTMAAAARPQFYRSVIEMVKRDRNHPSIIIWSILPNEGNQQNYPIPERQKLEIDVKALDPSRLTIQEEMYEDFEFIADVYANHDYQVSTGSNPIKPIRRQPYIIGEWNDDLGRVFTTPYDSEDRKIRQVTDDGKKMEVFIRDETVDGIVKWDFNGYLTTINNDKHGKNIGVYRISGVYGPFKDPLVRYWEGDMMRVQLGTGAIGDVVNIMNEWKADSPSTVYVAANAAQVELAVTDKNGNTTSYGKIAPNHLTGLWQGLFRWNNVPWSEGSTLHAVSYDKAGKKCAEDIRYASSYEVESDAVYELTNVTSNSYDSEHYRTYGSKENKQVLQADGSDLAVIAGVLKDKNRQKEDYGYENTTFEIVSGPGRLITGPTTYMLGGVNSCYLQTEKGKTGDTVIKAGVDIGKLYNQEDAAHFSYSPEGWTKMGNRAFAYGRDFRKSTTAGAYVDITFTGTQAVLYSQLEYSNYGKGTVTVDGVPDGSINFQRGENKVGDMNFQPLYTTKVLPYGTHTIRIQAQSTAAITVDAIKVFDGESDIVSNELMIRTEKMNEEIVESNPALENAPSKEKVTKEDVSILLKEAEKCDLKQSKAEGSLRLYRAIRKASQTLEKANPSSDELRGVRNLLNWGISDLQDAFKTVSYDSVSDNPGGMSGFYHYSKNPEVWVVGVGDVFANKQRTKGDYVSLTFEGGKLEMYGKKDTNHGSAAVYIDDKLEAKVDQYAAEDVFDVLMYTSPSLASGAHTVKLEVTGETTGNPGNACVGLSYVRIYDDGDTADTQKLQGAIREAGEIESENYPAQKYAAFKEVLDDAEFILAHPYTLQTDADQILAELEQAIAVLQWIKAESVQVQPSSAQLEKGQTVSLQAKVLPENADCKEVLFASSAPEIASVSEQGRVTALAAGQAVITVSSKENPAIKAEVRISVTLPKPSETEKPSVSAPGKPSGLSFKKVSTTALNISWKPVAGAQGYVVYRKKKGYEPIKVVTTAFVKDTKLKAGSTYSYKVAAYRMDGAKRIESSLSAECKGVTLPGKPSLNGKTKGRKVILKWKGKAIGDGVAVYMKKGKKPYTRIGFVGKKNKTFQKSKLLPGTSFRICAYKKLGNRKYYGKYSKVYNSRIKK